MSNFTFFSKYKSDEGGRPTSQGGRPPTKNFDVLRDFVFLGFIISQENVRIVIWLGL